MTEVKPITIEPFAHYAIKRKGFGRSSDSYVESTNPLMCGFVTQQAMRVIGSAVPMILSGLRADNAGDEFYAVRLKADFIWSEVG